MNIVIYSRHFFLDIVVRNSGFGHLCELKGLALKSVRLQSSEKEHRKSALRKIININYTPRSK